ncbi:hypothetical protein AMS68_001629 [Peltaster fructicola]|uniref:Calcineurin-like phosphoesterase domain-containing protein n=1 Tax=Peltaster fructicola TaxID=286661 RepID=A0A6H0XMX8_9PEZI|nr:hypothetical protein AMS68_001629 [Peltaster fructicola]
MTSSVQRPNPVKVRVVCISDTHGHSTGEGFKLPAGDVLVVAGDLTNQGSLHELKKAAHWLEQADFEHKIITAGNHDLSLDVRYQAKHAEGWNVTPVAAEECRQLIRNIPGVTYLEHNDCTLQIKGHSLRVFGSPYSVDRGKQNWAFQYSAEDAHVTWTAIPTNTNILITHTPPAGVLDNSTHWIDGGCPSLLAKVSAVRPLLHVFGHHHEGRGACILKWDEKDELTVTKWSDPGEGNRKQSLLDLTRTLHEQESGKRYTAAVNASIMRTSWSRSATMGFNKPIVVDLNIDHFACN